MTKRSRFDSQTIITGATIAAAVATVVCLALSLIVHPAGVKARLEVVQQRVAEAEHLSETTSGPLNYPNGAVCRQSTNLAATALQNRLRTAAAADGVILAKLDVVAGGGDGVLIPVTFGLEASGRYDAVVKMVAGLSKTQPELFIDQADLKSQTSQVSLKLNGRLYCSTSARL